MGFQLITLTNASECKQRANVMEQIKRLKTIKKTEHINKAIELLEKVAGKFYNFWNFIYYGSLRHLVYYHYCRTQQQPLHKTTFSKKCFLEANHIIVCTCGFRKNAFIETRQEKENTTGE